MTIEFADVSFAYDGGVQGVRRVRFSIGDGERVAIVGRNGAGKTTLAKLMMGLLTPDTGTVLLDGRDTAALTTAAIAERVGFVFQNPDDQLIAEDVQGELEYMPLYRHWNAARRAECVRWAAEVAGIGNILGCNPKDLPLSIRKFVTIAVALVMRPRHLVLDEPTAGLDANGRKLLASILQRLRRDHVTVVMISHDMQFVCDTCERVLAIADHAVVYDGQVAPLFVHDDVLAQAHIQRPPLVELLRDLSMDAAATRFDDIIDVLDKALHARRPPA